MAESRQDQLEPQELERWLWPHEVLRLFPVGQNETAKAAIAKRMQDGLLRTAAKHIIIRGKEHRLTLVPRVFWAGWPFRDDPDFWRRGDTERFAPSGGGYGSGDLIGRAYGVRISPADVVEHFGDLLADAPEEILLKMMPLTFTVLMDRDADTEVISGYGRAPTPPAVAAVSNAEVDAWYRSLPPQDQARGIRWLIPAAKSHFAPRKVVKKQIEPFVAGRPRGRPPVNR